MRNFLKKLHIMPNQLEVSEGSSSRGSRSTECLSGSSSPSRSSISGWLNSVTAKHSSSPPSSTHSESKKDPATSSDDEIDSARQECESSCMPDPGLEEEYQIQIAMELSAREDPEAVQIEAVKQISLGTRPPPNISAEIVAYRYRDYSVLMYDDKILDGFYDLYGVLAETTSEKMPSLIDLQRMPVSNNISWEAVLVNRARDPDLSGLEHRALAVACQCKSSSSGYVESDLVQKLATLVADYMGGSVTDPEEMSKAWRTLSNHLRASLGSVVLPLGLLKIGLARHRALLFKVLADTMGVPCRLVKGQQHTGSDDMAMNIIKVRSGREYIVDLMADPGTLIPSDAAGPIENLSVAGCFRRNGQHSHHVGISAPTATAFDSAASEIMPWGMHPSVDDSRDFNMKASSTINRFSEERLGQRHESSFIDLHKGDKESAPDPPGRFNHSHIHARSPSWTEGVSSPAVRRMKVKDVSQYMLDAAKDNPELAQKLHDVLLESGVVAPPGLFTEDYSDQVIQDMNQNGSNLKKQREKAVIHNKNQVDGLPGPLLPPLPPQPKPNKLKQHSEHLKSMMSSGVNHQDNIGDPPCNSNSSQSEAHPPVKCVRNMPVAAAAAATAAVVASSMVVAVAKSSADSTIEVPVAAAAAAVATSAAVTRQYEQLEYSAMNQAECGNKIYGVGAVGSGNELHESGHVHINGQRHDLEIMRDVDEGLNQQGVEKGEDQLTEQGSAKINLALDDVAEWEIPWEEVILGEKIGFGSYGEVYRGEWHGTEVAVKKFIDQDISGDKLEEFRSEVRIMKRLRHPNVVLFMGAVTRAPNLSIVTEFIHRGSLFRLLHRPNNQLDERKRLRMALDVARGMNYLHSSVPVIVHRDLKSPNLLVDRNWVVKVCDFGLSQMKQSTFLSSRSTAGTAEWMAPEVLRSEPSDEKCDVYSFGVILWEVTTLQQPWGGMNPMRVVGAVGFQHRRLDIPDDTNPIIADIIRKCWQTDSKLRPSFSEILTALKPLQKQMANMQTPIFQLSTAGGVTS